MRRTPILFAASFGLMVSAPGLALAQGHHARHHHSHHPRRHARIRHERFGAGWNQSGGQQPPAGTVTSFTNDVLTITLNDGSTVSGMVNNDTEFECTSSSTSTQGDQGNDNGDNGQNNSGDDNGASTTGANGDGGDNPSANAEDGNDGSSTSGDDNGGGDEGAGGQMCSTSSLTPDTPVAGASLEITNVGAIWNKLELITS
jgi:hypothetical protein